MEFYTPETNQESHRKLSNPRIQYFTLGQALTMFFTGFLGLNILAISVSNTLNRLFPAMSSIDMKTYTNFISYVILALLLILLSYLFNKTKFINNIKSLKDKNVWVFIVCGALLIYAVAFFISILQNYTYKQLGIDPSVNGNQDAINEMLDAHRVLIIIMVTILAPIVEETAYRQGLFESIRPKSRLLAYIVTIIVFSLIHFDWVGSFYNQEAAVWEVNKSYLTNELISLPSYIGGAAVLSFVYDHENNVVPGMFVHGIYNLIGIIGILLAS
ncbi:MAG: CPBP family intramembrane metalloprotease [Bacilli bacterium]|nr:CPBP family intramembrane metalloprotease [Bacilli bacterium]